MGTLFISTILSLLTISGLIFFKRNHNNTYWTSLWFAGPLFPLFLFSFITGFFEKSNSKIIIFLFSLLFLGMIIIALSEHNKITEDGFLINTSLFNKKKKISIGEILKIEFTYSDGSEPGQILLIKTKTFGAEYSIKSNLENVDGFLNQLKAINDKIIIVKDRKNITFKFFWVAVTFLMMLCSYKEFVQIILE